LKNNGIEGLIVIGGDGSMAAGEKICAKGIPVICIPASIDNDVYGTDETIGFDTAVNTAIDAIDKIRDTAISHERVFIVEVMGREHGFLALEIGAAAGAEYVIMPEVKYSPEQICRDLGLQHKKGKTSIIIIFAEGAGNPYEFAKKLKCSMDMEIRVSSLGYIQRGGSPSARSRVRARRFGVRAVELLCQGKKNRLVAIQNNKITDVPFSVVKNGEKKIDKKFCEMVKRLSR
jgi:6-phosphofructokinase 1